MMELICNWLLTAVSGLLLLVFTLMDGMISFSLEVFTSNVPASASLYPVLQALGIGLAVSIAVFQLFKFFASPLTEVKDRPIAILLRLFFSIGLIYFGNYILEIVFDITGKIYEKMGNGIDLESVLNSLGNTIDGDSGFFVADARNRVADLPGVNSALLIVNIVCCISLVVQFVKMMIEVVERFIILCLMIFSSPLAYSTVSSSTTMEIFKKWVSMYLSQCLLMILSVWGIRLFFDVLFYTTGGAESMLSVSRIIYALAIVKIIKRFDGYLQQLGLNPAAVNGPGIFDTIAATAGSLLAFSRMGGQGGGQGGGGARGGSPLGVGGYFKQMWNSHPAVAFGKAVASGVKSTAKGGSFVAAAGQSLKDTYMPNRMQKNALSTAANNGDAKTVGKLAANAAKDKPVKGAAEKMANALTPGGIADRKAQKDLQKQALNSLSTKANDSAQTKSTKAKASEEFFNNLAKNGGTTITNESGIRMATEAAKSLSGDKAKQLFSDGDVVTGVNVEPAQYKAENGATVTGGYMATFAVTDKNGNQTQVRMTSSKGAMMDFERKNQAMPSDNPHFAMQNTTASPSASTNAFPSAGTNAPPSAGTNAPPAADTSAYPAVKQSADSQPFTQQYTPIVQPDAEQHTPAAQPVAGQHTPAAQSVAEQYAPIVQPVAEQHTPAAQPAGAVTRSDTSNNAVSANPGPAVTVYGLRGEIDVKVASDNKALYPDKPQGNGKHHESQGSGSNKQRPPRKR